MCKGELLTVVKRDANDQRYPVAWAMVRSETKDNWSRFLKRLKKDIVLDDSSQLTIISDIQKVKNF